jgi:hypothetical protein
MAKKHIEVNWTMPCQILEDDLLKIKTEALESTFERHSAPETIMIMIVLS